MSPRFLVLIGAGEALLSLGFLSLGLSAPAEAKIVCDKGFQQVEGSWLSTPYCQDEYVAYVGNQYGFSATPDRVRSDPLFKQRLCRFIGQDIRIKESCDEVNPAGRGRF